TCIYVIIMKSYIQYCLYNLIDQALDGCIYVNIMKSYVQWTRATQLPSWLQKNANRSAAASTVCWNELPMPWPSPLFCNSRIGYSDDESACSSAIILREFAGSTRGSFSPVVISTAGYATPLRTLWYGDCFTIHANCAG